MANNTGSSTTDEEVLYDPEWAPNAIRAVKPQALFDYRWGRFFPSAPTFAAATKRWWQSASNLAVIEEFAVNTPRDRAGVGRMIEGKARTRINLNPNDLGQITWANVTSLTLGTPPGGDGNFVPQLLVAGSNLASVRRIVTGASLSAGDVISVTALMKSGTSGQVRMTASSASGISQVDGAVVSPAPAAANNGVFANVRTTTDGVLHQTTSTIALAATQVDHRVAIGPRSSTTGNITAYGLQWVKEPHAGEWVMPELAATAPDLETSSVNSGARGFFCSHTLHGWGDGVTAIAVEQIDDGTDNNRVAFQIDPATLALTAVLVRGGVVTTLTLGTVVLREAFEAGISWSDTGVLTAQLRGVAAQTVDTGSALPAMTNRRLAKSVAGSEAYVLAGVFGLFDTHTPNMQGVLAAAALPFDLYALNVSDPETVHKYNGADYSVSAYTGVVSGTPLLRRASNKSRYIRTIAQAPHKSPYDLDNDRPYYRTEWDGPRQAGDTLWIAFDFRGIDVSQLRPAFNPDGTGVAGSQSAIVQLKLYPDLSGLPSFALWSNTDCLRAVVGGKNTDSDPNSLYDRTVLLLPPLSPGVGYSFIARSKLGPAGNGELQLWQDGVKVIDRNDLTVGYPSTVSRWDKYGLYNSDTIGFMEVEHANMICGPDLSYLLTRPFSNPFR